MIFEDEPEKNVYLPIESSASFQDGWITETVSLEKFAGREIAAIGIQIRSDVDVTKYQLNLGQLQLLDGTSYKPEQPEDFKIEKQL